MPSDQNFIDFVVGQMELAGKITYKHMFGGTTLYCNSKVVALICDDQLFVKPTKAGRNYIGDVIEAPAYEGAKLSFLIEDQVEDKEWLSELIRISDNELPMPKPRKKKK